MSVEDDNIATFKQYVAALPEPDPAVLREKLAAVVVLLAYPRIGIRLWEAGQAYRPIRTWHCTPCQPCSGSSTTSTKRSSWRSATGATTSTWPKSTVSSRCSWSRGSARADEEEFALGLRCIAVPIVGVQQRTMAALSCSIPSARLDAAKAQRTLRLLKQ